jgi:hypothetical protein
VLLMIAVFLGLSQPAYAAPVTTTTVPDNLQKYVAGTPQWNAAPWMTSPACANAGGDFSVFTQNVLTDTPTLLQFFQPDFAGTDSSAAARGAEMLNGYRAIAAQITVPSGYCVTQLKQWAGTDANFQPFGFDWGDASGGLHTTPYICNNNVGADHAPCGGFYVVCNGAVTQQAHTACQAWNAFSDDYVQRVNAARTKANDDFPGGASAPIDTKPKSPGEIFQSILNWTVNTGMAQVVGFVLDGVINLWGNFLQIVVRYTAPDVSGAAFASVYNLIAGVALAVAFLGWLVGLAGAWRQGRLQFSLLGGVKAAAGVTLAGVGAIFMVQLADDCTAALAQAGGDLAKQADFTGSLVKSNPLIGLVAGIVIAVCLIFAIILLVVHGPLVMMWALMGSVAAAGQVHPASSGWLLKWISRLTALAWVPFVMVGEMDLAILLMLPVNGASAVQQIVDVMQGVLLVVLLVTSPFLLWELIDFVGDRVGGGAASGSNATQAAKAGTGKAIAAGGSAVKAGGSAVTTAVGTMMSAAADVGRQMQEGFHQGLHGGSDSGGSSGGSASALPRAEDPGTAGGPGAATNGQPAGAADDRSRPGADRDDPLVPREHDRDPRVANRGRVVGNAPRRPATTTSGGAPSPGGAGGRGTTPPLPPPI